MYNPVSVMKCFDNREFRNYWFETGTPTFLVDLLQRMPVSLGNLDVPETAFSAYDPERLDPLPLLVQTGYLTIASVSVAGRSRQYRLAFPNFEIEESFSYWLAKGFAALPDDELSGALRSMVAALTEGRADDMLKDLRAFFTNVPNAIAIDNEKYYQTIFFTVFKLLGAMIEAEVNTNLGRIDAVVKTRTDIFVFEFKLHDTAEAAMRVAHGDRVARVINEELLAGTVLLAQAHGLLAEPLAVELAVLAVAVPFGSVRRPVLLPEQLQGDVAAAQLVADVSHVRRRPRRAVALPHREQQGIQALLVHPRRQRPAQPRGTRPPQVVRHRAAGQAAAARDLPNRQLLLQAQPEQLRYLPHG